MVRNCKFAITYRERNKHVTPVSGRKESENKR
jgi:hypothetical protein